MSNTNYEPNSNHLLRLDTRKIPAIKSLIEALKEIFRDVTIKFTPKSEKINELDSSKNKIIGGMYITALNSNSNVLVRLHLEADKFCNYVCNREKITIGVNMTNFYKIIKFLNNDDELSITYDARSLNQLNLQYINKHKKLVSNYYLNLLDLKEENIVIANQKFDFVITMSSSDFNSLIKNMTIIAEHVDIKFINIGNSYSLNFSCVGEFASQESIFNASDNVNIINVMKNEESLENDNNNDTLIIQGLYELKALSLFSKCSTLCPTIDLYIKNNSPLVIKYNVADMGTVHLILSPIINNSFEDDTDNDSDNN